MEEHGDLLRDLKDVGIANFSLKFVYTDVKIVDKKDNGYIWSEIHKLWLPCNNRSIRSYIVSKMTPLFYLNVKRQEKSWMIFEAGTRKLG